MAQWICDRGIEVLNVAGNSEQSVPGIEDFVFTYLGKVFQELGLKEARRDDAERGEH